MSVTFTGILETYWGKHSVIASTPPPSPTSGESGKLLLNCKNLMVEIFLLVDLTGTMQH